MSTMLYHGLEIEVRELAERNYVPKPTIEFLNHFESELGMRLPSSYREFALLFGAGELGGFYRIAAPLPVQHDYNLKQFNLVAHGSPEDRLWELYPSDIAHFYFFAATVGGVLFACNTKGSVLNPHHEYPIYRLPGFGHMEVLASTFAEFIVKAMTQEPVESGESWPKPVFSRFLLP